MPEGGRGVIELGPVDLGLAALLVVVAGLISLALRLGLERRLAVAAARTLVQLLLVGYVLTWIFRAGSPGVVLAAVAIMTLAASREAVRRSSRTFRGIYLRIFVTLLLTGTLTTAAVTQVVIGVRPWYAPQYVVPLLGMVFGNSLTGISLCLDQLLSVFDEHRSRIELELSFGATSWEAARASLREAVRRGMVPTINAMSVAGIVSLPGMMTGQILGGSDPMVAVTYQVVVMFMLAGATALGAMVAVLLVWRRLFNVRHQLLAHEIIRRR